MADVTLDGYLLFWDHRKDRLLIAFPDPDMSEPSWLPAAHVQFNVKGRFGWGRFSMAQSWADQRTELSARAENRKRTYAARAIRRPKIFNPKKSEPEPAPEPQQKKRTSPGRKTIQPSLWNDLPQQRKL